MTKKAKPTRDALFDGSDAHLLGEHQEREAFEDAVRSLTDPACHEEDLARDGDSYDRWPTALAWEVWLKRSALSTAAHGVGGMSGEVLSKLVMSIEATTIGLHNVGTKELIAFARAILRAAPAPVAAPQPAAAIPGEWREFVERVAKQKPEKPDYWSSCSQCEHNISDAEDLLEAAPPCALSNGGEDQA